MYHVVGMMRKRAEVVMANKTTSVAMHEAAHEAGHERLAVIGEDGAARNPLALTG